MATPVQLLTRRSSQPDRGTKKGLLHGFASQMNIGNRPVLIWKLKATTVKHTNIPSRLGGNK
jgi:hypothetical protein